MTTERLVITQEPTKFTIRGRVDSTNAVELGQTLDQAIKNGHVQIILDMLHVEYLCSHGIRVLLKAYKDLQAIGGNLGIQNPSECVENVLGLVALNEMLIK